MENNSNVPLNKIYEKGQIVNFKVKNYYGSYCELIDEKTSVVSYLQNTSSLKLTKGQIVECRIQEFTEKHPKITLEDITQYEQNKNSLTESQIINLIDNNNYRLSPKEFAKLLLSKDSEKSYQSQCHRWIQSLLNKKADLKDLRRDLSNILELSDLLDKCDTTEREKYQERLTFLIELFGYYIRAYELIQNKNNENADCTPDGFVDNLIEKLNKSGFVYHPNKNFNILSCLFLIDSELMNRRIKDLLNIVYSKNIQIWAREPFCSALINLLELYVRKCDGLYDKKKDNKDMIDSNIRALAIQLLLVKNSKVWNIEDFYRNAARLCTLYSYSTTNSEDIVNAAFVLLFNPNVKLPTYNINNLSTLPYLIGNSIKGKIQTENSFTRSVGRLSISDNGIQLKPANENNLYPVFPEGLNLWKKMQVFLPIKTKTKLVSVKSNDILPYKSVWTEIENQFFNISKTQTQQATINPKRHHVGDLVKISFVAQDENDKGKYFCHIEDQYGGDGFIFMKNIVSYNISTSLRHFYTSNGERLVFKAKIIGENSGSFEFSMINEIKQILINDQFYTYDGDIICSVGDVPNSYGCSPAITIEGVSVSLKNAGQYNVNKYDRVRCKLIGPGTNTFCIECEIEDFTQEIFDMVTAFKTLMENIAIDSIQDDFNEQTESQMLKSDKVLDESDVKEIIYLIDRMSLIKEDYVQSFNYLGFARILCLLIGWESQAAYYKGRMDIIFMLHEFAKNSKVDEEELSKLENANAELFSNNPVLKERFMQLQTVSYKDKNERNEDLFNIIKNDNSLNDLASLVLAYNIIKHNRMEKCASDIHNRIIQTLNLTGYETNLKLYGNGCEDERIEYKTSIIFPAGGNGKEPNLEMQMNVILKVIDAFFNTDGGTLYIGVNNSGYGVGLENDLNSIYFGGDKDKYIRTICDKIAGAWNNKILTTYTKVEFDKENNDKDVVCIYVEPVPEGIPYEDCWYVRSSGSNRGLSEDGYNEYKTNKSSKYNNVPQPETTERGVKSDIEKKKHKETLPELYEEPQKNIINSGKIRMNILNDWEDEYVQPYKLFKFLDDGKFSIINNYDYDDKPLLTLVVKEEEKSSWLILGYENGNIVKISIEELLKSSNTELLRNQDEKLIFASIANDEDSILTIMKENKSRPKTILRLDKVSSFETGRLSDKGEIRFKPDAVSKVLTFDVVPEEIVAKCWSINEMPKNVVGYANGGTTKDLINYLHLHNITEI